MFDAQAHVVQTQDGLIPQKLLGLTREDARKAVVVELLEAEGALVRVEDRVIPTPFGDRSGVVIEPWLTDQWYVDAAKLALPALEAVQQRRHQDRPRDLGEDLVQLAREHPALVRLAPAVVGPPHPGLVRRGRQRLRRRDRGGGASAGGRPAAAPGRGRARHLVLVGPVAVRDARLARRDRGPQAPLPQRRPHLRLRHPVLLGCAHGDAGDRVHGRGAVEDALPPRPRPRRAGRRRCPSRRATPSTRSA